MELKKIWGSNIKSTVHSDKFVNVNTGPSPVLGRAGEEKLVDWIVECIRRGFLNERKMYKQVLKSFGIIVSHSYLDQYYIILILY